MCQGEASESFFCLFSCANSNGKEKMRLGSCEERGYPVCRQGVGVVFGNSDKVQAYKMFEMQQRPFTNTRSPYFVFSYKISTEYCPMRLLANKLKTFFIAVRTISDAGSLYVIDKWSVRSLCVDW